MRQANSVLKLSMAVFSLLLTVLIWQRGLQDSFERPSVAPKISLIQTEMAVLSSSSVPEPFKEVFLGKEPQEKLYQALKNIPLDELKDRQRLLLAVLENSDYERKILLKDEFIDENKELIRNSILVNNTDSNQKLFSQVKKAELDPLLYQLSCLEIEGDKEICIDKKNNLITSIRLLSSQLLPIGASFVGFILLLRQCWIFIRKKNNPWPKVISTPLSLIDMVLLIAGGFVVIGEVAFPAFIVPIADLFFKEVASPLRESLRVLIGYCSMTIGPLLILRYQLKGIVSSRIDGGWLQWRFKPIGESVFKSINGWLMIMPLVLLIGWIMTQVVGDQGGSNPLLDLVLSSKEVIPLLILLITTVILAPIFEELIFRGILLPVLAGKMGKIGGVVISALIFALAHLSVGELPPLFVLGIGLGVMRLSSGRLFPCALMHSLWNGVTFASLLLVA